MYLYYPDITQSRLLEFLFKRCWRYKQMYQAQQLLVQQLTMKDYSNHRRHETGGGSTQVSEYFVRL